MTTPTERTRALLYAEEFLLRLANDKSYRSLKDIRDTARMILRHYPWRFHIASIKSDNFSWPDDVERDGSGVAEVYSIPKRPGVGGTDDAFVGRKKRTVVSETSEGISK